MMDYLYKHFEKPPTQPKFDDIVDGNKKKEIWDYNPGISALSKQQSGKGVGDHIYGIREQVCSKRIVGSDSLWNRIPCPHNDNVAWKIVTITLTEVDISTFEIHTGRDLVTELNLKKSGTTYSGQIQNMIAEFNDVFLKLIKIKLDKIPELNNDEIPSLSKQDKVTITKYMENMIKYDGTNKDLYDAHVNFMKFYNWKRYCDSRKANMFWTDEQGAGKILDDRLKEMLIKQLQAMSNTIDEIEPVQLTTEEVQKKQDDSPASCSTDPIEVDDTQPMEIQELPVEIKGLPPRLAFKRFAKMIQK